MGSDTLFLSNGDVAKSLMRTITTLALLAITSLCHIHVVVDCHKGYKVLVHARDEEHPIW